MADIAQRKIEFEVLLARDGRRAAEIAKAAKIDPKSLWALRRIRFRNGPSDSVVGRVAAVLGVSAARLWGMVCDIPYSKRVKNQPRNQKRNRKNLAKRRAS